MTSNNVMTELRKLAWVETVVPELGTFAPTAERLIRRGARFLLADATGSLPGQQVVVVPEPEGKDGQE